ncbi:hypothetical protein [Pseudolysinimonas sp.]|jgi:hypothetical protein|uniref:hypothetical protein n=1 Tax=Pseudolysinimonas sp. TaxID=2680009 RepID=UPI0037831271
MTHIEMSKDLYPELLIAALRDEMRRVEREQRARDAAAQRRRDRWAVLRDRFVQWASGRGERRQ